MKALRLFEFFITTLGIGLCVRWYGLKMLLVLVLMMWGNSLMIKRQGRFL